MRILILVAMAALVACSAGTPEQASEVAARPVKMERVGVLGDAQYRSFPATVQASDKTDLSFRVSGELSSLPVRAGQTVQQGQVLAKLDASGYQLALNDRKARLDLADAQFKRIAPMFASKLISSADYDQSKAELDIARTAYQTAQKDLTYTTLYAPFSGVIAETYTENHQTVAASKPVLRMQSDAQLEVHLQLPERLVAQIRGDESGKSYQPQVTLDALPDDLFYGRYKEHNAAADNQTGGYPVVLTIKRPKNLNILPGMTARVQVDMSRVLNSAAQKVLIPVGAVFAGQTAKSAEGWQSVWVVDETSMQAQLRAVQVGQLKQQGVEVLQGLSEGELIITAGVHQLHDGMPVRPWVNERGL
jgi:RND family efflux transporter MFP subunit